jgi:circadian clock protein KaiB
MRERIMGKFLLKLYISGQTPRSERAIANLHRLCEEELSGEYELDIVDVLEHPERAVDEKIIATPTLVKELPPPLQCIVGDLSDKEKVLLVLSVQPCPEHKNQE